MCPRRPLTAASLAVLALLACRDETPRGSLIAIERHPGTPLPEYALLDWLADDRYLLAGERLPESGRFSNVASPLISVFVETGEDRSARRAFVRGYQGTRPVAWAAARVSPSSERLTLTLRPWPPDDGDGDGIPDPIDDCPAPEPDPTRCEEELGPRDAADAGPGQDGGQHVSRDGGSDGFVTPIDAPESEGPDAPVTVADAGVDAGGMAADAADAAAVEVVAADAGADLGTMSPDAAAVQAPINLVRNPGFEQGMTFWTRIRGRGTVSAPARSGVVALHESLPRAFWQQGLSGWLGGQSYRIVAWGKSAEPLCRVGIQAGPPGASAATFRHEADAFGADWSERTTVVTVPPDTSWLQLFIINRSDQDPAPCSVDDVVMAPVNP